MTACAASDSDTRGAASQRQPATHTLRDGCSSDTRLEPDPMASRAAKQKRLEPIAAPAAHAAASASAAASSSSSSAAAAAAPASAPAAPAAAPALCDVLVLGMAYVSAAFEDACVVRSETTASPLRDRARLQKLQAENPHFRFITQNDNQTSEQCKGQRHLKGKFDQRSAKELRDTFQSSNPSGPLVFSHIMADYFRFPGEYMRTAYVPFMRSMLPKLVELGLMDSATQLVLPNLPTLLHALLHVKLRRPLHNGADSPEPWGVRGHEPCFLHFAPLPAEDYLLYAVTSRIAPATLGGFQNSQEISQLSKRCPFVTLTLSDNAKEARRSFFDVVDDVAAAAAQAPPIAKLKAKPGPGRRKAREQMQRQEGEGDGTAVEVASPSVSPSTAISSARMLRSNPSSPSSSSSSSAASPASSTASSPVASPRAAAAAASSSSVSPRARALISAPTDAALATAARSRGSKRPAAVSAQPSIAATAHVHAASPLATIDLAKVKATAAAMDQTKRQRTQH